MDVKIEQKIDQLLAVLDVDAERVQESLSYLDQLRSLVVKRDDAGLSALLYSIQSNSGKYVENASRRKLIREDLAEGLGWEIDQVRLSRLCTLFPVGQRAKIVERKAKLESLVGLLSREHLKTSLLLVDCARFNGLLLRGLLDLGRVESLTYGSDGSSRRSSDSAFVSVQL